jgi:AraC-like DNA-binding protein
MSNKIIHRLHNQIIQKLDVPVFMHDFYEYFWKVSWDIPEGEEQIQKILTEPKADLFIEEINGEWQLSPIRSSIFEINLSGKSSVFGLKLRPASQYLYINQCIPLPMVDFHEDFETMCNEVVEFFEDSPLIYTSEMMTLNSIITSMERETNISTVDNFSKSHNMTPRGMQRMFKKFTGLSAKWVLCRYRTLEAVQMAKDSGDEVDWAHMASELGYSDQAHFIRDFKSNLSMTPKEYHNILKGEPDENN